MITAPIRETIERIHASDFQLVYEFTGAGSLALTWLHSVPGSSCTVLEATDRYAAPSLAELLGHTPEKSVAVETALEMAAPAYRRAVHLSAGNRSCLGVACTATIATDRTKRGDHRCCVAVQDARQSVTYDLILLKGERDRLAEETLVAHIVIEAVARACGIADVPAPALAAGEHVVVARHVIRDPVQDLLDGAIRTVTVHPDGRLVADEAVTGGLLSGSFNPLHAGHEGMAHAAAKFLRNPVAFELPIVNADKPPLQRSEVERRLTQFHQRRPVVLTRAPLFLEKADLFPGCVFVVGYDTAERLIDPHYYGGEAARDEAFVRIRARGCSFLVAGRVINGVVRTLRDLSPPAAARDLFVELPESLFQVDVSSTELRGARNELAR